MSLAPIDEFCSPLAVGIDYVMAHEIGHALRLEHEDRENDEVNLMRSAAECTQMPRYFSDSWLGKIRENTNP